MDRIVENSGETSISPPQSSSSSSSTSYTAAADTDTTEMKCSECFQCHDVAIGSTGTKCADISFCCYEFTSTLTKRQSTSMANLKVTLAAVQKIPDIDTNRDARLLICTDAGFTSHTVNQLAMELGRSWKKKTKKQLVPKMKQLLDYSTMPRSTTCKLFAWPELNDSSSEEDSDDDDDNIDNEFDSSSDQGSTGGDESGSEDEDDDEEEEEEDRRPLIQMTKKSIKLICDDYGLSKTVHVQGGNQKRKAKNETERRLLIKRIELEEANPGSQPRSAAGKREQMNKLADAPRTTARAGNGTFTNKRKAVTTITKKQSSFKKAKGITDRSYRSSSNNNPTRSRTMVECLQRSQAEVRPATNEMFLQIGKNEKGRRMKILIAYTGTHQDAVNDLDYAIDELYDKRAQIIRSKQDLATLTATQDAEATTHRLVSSSPVHASSAIPA